MSTSGVRKFGLLLWKNAILHKRKWMVTLLEVLIPALFALLLVYIREKVFSKEFSSPIIWKSFKVNRLPYNLYPGGPMYRHSGRWNLSFTPDIPVTRRIVNNVLSAMKGDIDSAWVFDSEDEMIAFLVKPEFNESSRSMLGGIVFSSFNVSENTVPKNVTYKIRLSYSPKNAPKEDGSFGPFSGDPNWCTRYTYPVTQSVGPREQYKTMGGSPGYYREGFLALQHQLDISIIRELEAQNGLKSNTTYDVDLEIQRIPYPPFLLDNFVLVIQKQLPLIIMLGYIFASLNIVKNIVHEKEMKLKETMKMMGLPSWLHWSAWFINYFLLLTISVGIVVFVFFVKLSSRGRVITYSNWSVFFVYLNIYVCSIIFFSFAISVFFKKSRSGAAAGGLFFLITFLPYFFLQPRYPNMSLSGKLAACLLPNIAMALGSQIIGMYEGTEAGVQWSNVAQGVSVDDNFTLLHVMCMLLVDCVIYMIIAWYVEAVRPGEFGTPLPWHFFLMRSYWLGPYVETEELNPESVGATAAAAEPPNERAPLLRKSEPPQAINSPTVDATTFEPEPDWRPCSISLQEITKVYGRGSKEKVAVNNLNLNMYEGQITALLGHNGAGKTTTMSMITGFIPATKGRIMVNGIDIRRDMSAIRRLLGLCPQHDVLFEQLTIEEHLRFFAKLKDCRADLVEAEIERMLMATNLAPRRHSRAGTLSGGMRRKLSVAIALIGGSRIIILDEPTSGMDPDARRELWTFLQTERTNRTMLLSTHFMDEADVLGDRIAIMASGVVQCCGSSLFLKSRYGAGYHLTMVKSSSCDVQVVIDLILQFVPEARPESNIADELSIILPAESSGAFEGLFTYLEEHRKELGIVSYGASVTTMEEVFLKVGEYEDTILPPDGPKMYGSSSRTSSFSSSINAAGTSIASFNDVDSISEARSVYDEEHNQSFLLYLQQFWAIFLKRCILSRRNFIITIVQLVVPIFSTFVGLLVLKTWPSAQDSVPLTLTLAKFGQQVISYGQPANGTTNDFSNQVINSYVHQFFSKDTTLLYMNDQEGYAKEGYITYLWRLGAKDIARFNRENVIGAYFQPISDHTLHVKALFNDQPYHSPAITLNSISNAMLRTSLGAEYLITTINHPQPRTINDKVHSEYTDYTTGFMVAFTVVFGMSFLVSSFSIFLVRERSSKVKHLHFVSGTNKYVYWLATFAWDYINYLIPCIFIVVVFLGFQVEAYSGSPIQITGIFLLLTSYGWAVLPLMYLCAYAFDVPSTAMVWLTILNILTGLGTLLTVNILEIPQLELLHLADSLKLTFGIIFPNYNLGQGLFDYYSNYYFNKTCNQPIVKQICDSGWINFTCCPHHCAPYCATWNTNVLGWAPDGIGRMLVFLSLQGAVFFAACLIVETSIFYRIVNIISPERLRAVHLMHRQQIHDSSVHPEEDADVAEERRHILTTPIEDLHQRYSLELHQITRYYGSRCAVDRVSCAIAPGECFGLLGVNGAGKSTTFKMLTGDLGFTSGDAFVNGWSVSAQLRRVQQMMGYCPQFDALLDHLTGRETLVLFARLRGLKEELILGEVESLLNALLLRPFADRLVSTYSGGNRRKLSTAVALVGCPPVVCLDEPTTGMDPVARRHVWRALTHYRDRGRTLVLTSHSMEECEALCTKIAIMVNGQFKCFGSSQQLKYKFGRGYTLLVQVPFDAHAGGDSHARNFMSFVEQNLPSAELKDIHQGLLHYHLHPHPDVTWASVFGLIERHRVQLRIENYSVSQTSLEQVFLSFARAQHVPDDSERTSCFDPLRRCCICCQSQPSVDELSELRPSIQA